MFFTKNAPEQPQRDIWYEASRRYLFRNFGWDIGLAYVAPSRYQQFTNKIKIKFEASKYFLNRHMPWVKWLSKWICWLAWLF